MASQTDRTSATLSQCRLHALNPCDHHSAQMKASVEAWTDLHGVIYCHPLRVHGVDSLGCAPIDSLIPLLLTGQDQHLNVKNY